MNRHLLKKGIDGDKDQSYFLYRLTQGQLQRVLFPLGEYRKTDVQMLAAQRKIPAAERPESQEICFIPDNDYRAFLKERAPEVLREGDMIMTDGSIVGRHKGMAFYTVGQRRGLGVSAGERLYVVRIDRESNRVVLGQRADLETGEMVVSHGHFLLLDRLTAAMKADVKVRYRSPSVPATIRPLDDDTIRVTFGRPVPGIAPGQAAVFYDHDVVIGGGIIT
jgi:tRNA-specific 2-thiouridylase